MTNLLPELQVVGERFRKNLSEEPTWRSLIAGTIPLGKYLSVLKTFRDYQYVTPPYLRDSVDRLGKLAEDKEFRLWLPQYQTLIDRYREHADEEEHPEPHWKWAMKDMAALDGWDYIMDIRPSPPVQAYISWYRHVSKTMPWATVGVAHPLEYISAGHSEEAAGNLIRNSGILNIENAVRSLQGHSVDTEHIGEYEYLKTITNEKVASDILATAELVARLFVSYPQHFGPPRNILEL